MKMMWAQLDFFPGDIYNFVVSDKRKLKFKKFFPHGFLRYDKRDCDGICINF